MSEEYTWVDTEITCPKCYNLSVKEVWTPTASYWTRALVCIVCEKMLGIQTSYEGPPSQPAWHEVLKVDPNATQDQIRTAFRALAKEYHPDKGGDPEVFKEIQLAYEQSRS